LFGTKGGQIEIGDQLVKRKVLQIMFPENVQDVGTEIVLLVMVLQTIKVNSMHYRCHVIVSQCISY
jgi:hypothetical protein